MLPNFLIIGAQKCGTTTLLDYLNPHPQVFMSPSRETQFFIMPNLYSKGLHQYETQFFSGWNGEKAIGEKTPGYLFVPGTAQRIHQFLGDNIKIVVCLRSPAERAFSGYRQNLKLGRECEPFDKAIQLEPERIAQGAEYAQTFGYLARGYYYRQLQEYLTAFPQWKDTFHFIIIDNLVQQQETTLKALCTFLDVQYVAPQEKIASGHAEPKAITVKQSLLGAKTVDWGGTLIQNPSAELLAFVKTYEKTMKTLAPPSPQEVLDLNDRYFREDILALQELIGSPLHQWLPPT